jgi:hypothetical protein
MYIWLFQYHPVVICVNTYDDNPSRTVDLVGYYVDLVGYYIFSNVICRELASSFSDWVRKY